MRILMVTPQLPTSTRPGRMAPVARQIDSIRATGAEVDVLEVKGIRKLKYVQSLPKLHARVGSVDLIHAHYGFSGWIARSQFRKPVVTSFMGSDLLGASDGHGRVDFFNQAVVQIDRWLAHMIDAVIVKSAEMAQIVAPIKAHVVPNGVDLEVFDLIDPSEARATLGWAEDKRYVLFPGNPEDIRKGFSLAQAVVASAAAYVDVPIEVVPLWGITPSRVPLYMNGCDALLMTSFWEGSPNAVKEALACNLPIVSVPVGDVVELLAGVEPSAICPRDEGVLAEALSQILIHRRRSNGRAALQAKGLDLMSVARHVTDIYASVLAGRRR